MSDLPEILQEKFHRKLLRFVVSLIIAVFVPSLFWIISDILGEFFTALSKARKTIDNYGWYIKAIVIFYIAWVIYDYLTKRSRRNKIDKSNLG